MKTLTTPKITPARLRRMRKRLVAFAEDVLASLPRKDQRQRGETYLRGLLLDGKRKSIEPMAARLAAADADGAGWVTWSRRCSSSSTKAPGTRPRCAAGSPSA